MFDENQRRISDSAPDVSNSEGAAVVSETWSWRNIFSSCNNVIMKESRRPWKMKDHSCDHVHEDSKFDLHNNVQTSDGPEGVRGIMIKQWEDDGESYDQLSARARNSLLDFRKASTFLPSVPETRIQRHFLHSISAPGGALIKNPMRIQRDD